jgi:hypothetical protein
MDKITQIVQENIRRVLDNLERIEPMRESIETLSYSQSLTGPAGPSVSPLGKNPTGSVCDKNNHDAELELKETECPPEKECGVCKDKSKKIAFGCGHMTCISCSNRLKQCPECRDPIVTRLRVYV